MAKPRLVRAFVLGVAAPLCAGVLIAIAISLSYSATVGLAEEHEFEAALARAEVASRWLQHSGPVVGRVLLLLAAIWVGRRARERPMLEGAALLAGAAAGTLPFVLSFAGGGVFMAVGSVLTDAVVITAGMSLGRRALALELALTAATKSIRSASSLEQIVAALAEFVGGTTRVTILVEEGERWRSVADSRGEALELARDVLAPEDGEGEGRMLRSGVHGALADAPALCLRLSSDRGPMGLLLLAARPARRLRTRRRALAQSLSAQVSLAWHRLELLEEAQRTALARERERVSHEIHDTLAQDLISAIMHLEMAAQHLASGDDAVPAVSQAEDIVRKCLAQARDLVWSSWRTREAGLSLAAALQHTTERWSRDKGIRARYQAVGGEASLSPRVESLLLGAAREALANVHRHAEAREVNVTLSYINGMVALDVRDDGVGFDADDGCPPQSDSGFGLASLRDRTERLGGRLVVESRAGEGTIVSVQVPGNGSGS